MTKPTTRWHQAQGVTIDEDGRIVDESGNYLVDESGNKCIASPKIFKDRKQTEWTDD